LRPDTKARPKTENPAVCHRLARCCPYELKASCSRSATTLTRG
jgi:hypothetical protein